MKIPSTIAVTNGDTHHRSVRKVRAEIAARAGWIRPGGVIPDGGDEEVVVMTSLSIGHAPGVVHLLWFRNPDERRGPRSSRR
ncbi:MAG TPA: hypothetical protein VF003_08685 [Pseudonocardiaceae bacterium]